MRKIVTYLGFLVALFHVSSALADIRVTIQQINPDGYAYSNLCKNKLELCHVFMGIKPQYEDTKNNDLELDVGVTFRNNKAYFQFKSGWEYIVTQDQNRIHIMDLPNQTTTEDTISLIIRPPMAQGDPANGLQHNPVIRPADKKLAQLKIIIENE